MCAGAVEAWESLRRDLGFIIPVVSLQGRTSPDLALLVECKRSEHPYVFFQRITSRPIPGFPVIAGLRPTISIYAQGSNGVAETPPSSVLGLDRLSFVASGP